MTVVGLDDTDSRERGMCTTYVASRIAERLDRHGSVERVLLVRLNPAVEYKTRGNAALAVHTDCDPDHAFEIARDELASLSVSADESTNPGLVVASHGFGVDDVPETLASFSWRAIRDHLEIADAEAVIADQGYRTWYAGNGRGRIGALAAIGSWRALDEWTVEHISYRESDRWGTPRTVDEESIFEAAAAAYPTVWDTVDRSSGEVVCVPHTPGPVLHGVRGDGPDAVRRVVESIESEPIASSRQFLTNQGTDVHLREGSLGALRDGRAYRADGIVTSAPETRRGGHVFVTMTAPRGDHHVECAAFEPTKRFRDHVRALRPGDRLTVCGEVTRGTLKLEKFAVRTLDRHDRVNPPCPSCDRTMESAGRSQGYRCRECAETAAERAVVEVERDLEPGWYEAPPRARRHVAKPLIRGGFDAPTHPER